MPLSSEYYIKLCIEKIEKRYFLVDDRGEIQRNLENLSQKIEEKTGVLISLSTLKRIWRKKFKQKPQTATLNALAAILDYKDWQDFVERNQGSTNRFPGKNVWIPVGIVAAVSIVVVLILMVSQEQGSRTSLVIKGDIDFNAKKTEYLGVPTTVIFTYDVSNIEADSFSFQQSWNDNFRRRIDPEGKAISSIYYESGYHRAKLFANNTKIAELPIHIFSEGWEPNVYYDNQEKIPIYFPGDQITGSGELHISRELLEDQHVDLSRYFYTRTVESRRFNVSSDNFTLLSRLKLDSLAYSDCPWMSIIVVTEKNIHIVELRTKGCENLAYYKVGEIERRGGENDLSSLGCNLYTWQEVAIQIRNKNAVISINGKECVTDKYEEDYGDIMALIYSFERTGSIDFVRLSDENNNVVFEDSFDE
ncbi:MAG: hypothetical protein ACWGNV_07045 [Bacteroidales bacterium]